MENTIFMLYVPVKIADGSYEYVRDSAGRIRVFASKAELVKKVSYYDYIYVYSLISRIK